MWIEPEERRRAVCVIVGFWGLVAVTVWLVGRWV